MAVEKKRRRLGRSRYVETLNQNQIPPNHTTTNNTWSTIHIYWHWLKYRSRSTTNWINQDLIQIVKTDVALDLHNVDPALDLLHHHKKQIDPYGYTSPLPPPPYIRQALLHIHRQLLQTMTISILLHTILGGWQRHAIIVTQNCDPQKHPHYAVLCSQVNLPPLQTLPDPLHQLFVGDTAKSRCFRNNIRSYISAFAFASLGVMRTWYRQGYTVLE